MQIIKKWRAVPKKKRADAMNQGVLTPLGLLGPILLALGIAGWLWPGDGDVSRVISGTIGGCLFMLFRYITGAIVLRKSGDL